MPSGSIKTWGQLFLTWPCLPKQVTQPLWVSVNWSAGHYVELIVSMWLLSCFSRVRLYDPMGCSPPGSSVPGILQARITGVGCQALLQGNLPNPGIEPGSPALQADSLSSEPPGKPFLSIGKKKVNIRYSSRCQETHRLFGK